MNRREFLRSIAGLAAAAVAAKLPVAEPAVAQAPELTNAAAIIMLANAGYVHAKNRDYWIRALGRQHQHIFDTSLYAMDSTGQVYHYCEWTGDGYTFYR